MKNSSAHSKIHTLIIHRDPALRRTLVDGLAGDGCQVFEAASHPEGLARLSQVKPELILLSASDQEDGRETFSQIRLVTNAPTIFLADEPISPYRSLCERDDAAVLTQPIHLAAVMAEVRRLCHSGTDAASPENDNQNTSRLPRSLRPSHWRAIDRALLETGDGEVRLIVQRGCLRFLERLKTVQLDIEPAVT